VSPLFIYYVRTSYVSIDTCKIYEIMTSLNSASAKYDCSNWVNVLIELLNFNGAVFDPYAACDVNKHSSLSISHLYKSRLFLRSSTLSAVMSHEG